jgi:hypothetical protein
MNSDNPKKQNASDSNDCSADKIEADPSELEDSECEPTVPILTLEDDSVAQAEKDNGSDPYNTD